MATIRRFEEIQAWQKARELVGEIYRISGSENFQRDYGLRNQICRAAVSSMSNIAEGFARRTSRDFAHFLDVARGSAVEVQSLLYVAFDVKYISSGQLKTMYTVADEVIALVGGLTSYLRGPRGRS
ncbi:MAG TPA: four helix bundle protein [Terriglobia bacterium]|nr:four helix bundle protein [Terriglobia bacterium]